MSRASSEFAVGLADLFHQFGESLVYRPSIGGTNRAIIGIVQPDDRDIEEGQAVERDMERVWITVRRDAAHGTDGGINAPAMGDQLLQNSEAESTPYVYQGEVRNQSADTWDLLYGRQIVRRQGPPHAA